MIYFSSDFHLGHSNMCLGETSWQNSEPCRPFDSVQEMDRHIIDQVNNTVGVDDVLYFLGDFAFGSVKVITYLFHQFKCNNIYFVVGNHDKTIVRKQHLQNLFAGYDKRMEIKIDKQLFVLDHYALQVWNKGHHGAIHLHGHSHGSLPPHTNEHGIPFKRLDVGIDDTTITDEYRPVSLDEVMEVMKFRIKLGIDHHR